MIEAYVPDLGRFDRGQRVGAISVDEDTVRLEVATYDAATQRTDSQQITIGSEGVRLYPVKVRSAYPSKLDLMARLAGMRLRDRFGDWDRSPFTSTSGKHVSVYELQDES